MRKPPRISEAEWQVMKIIWKEQPLTADQIIQRLADKTPWHRKTIKTLIGRLVRKGALRFEKLDRQYRYWPLLKEENGIRGESRSFLDRVFDGALQPMMAHFVRHQKLTPKDIQELQAILKQKGKQP
ncbi:MAG: BlaI/MecI/CopY family transcriptional regulator [Verrucomicrobia bacterium]|nr:BlaI/MecI/CopY family transcriptional regulator [Verrucomicrobiota bacterium]MBU4430141.1 BlaI/MecI/CopY family transcriptional regulator [Verrucomicrobiota bacterium]MCG2681048.1 BlaI/MecI/CopY family transcriptional regulator [Kiritimatiellia bacterium]